MIERINSLINIFDVGDLKFFFLVAKKNLKNLITLSLIFSLLVFLISSNLEKKFLSKATIVIEPDDNKIVNIEEALVVNSSDFVTTSINQPSIFSVGAAYPNPFNPSTNKWGSGYGGGGGSSGDGITGT